MAYQRKTYDEWQIHSNNGYGWEEVCAEDTRKAGMAQLRCYRENEPHISHRLVCRRIPITEAASVPTTPGGSINV